MKIMMKVQLADFVIASRKEVFCFFACLVCCFGEYKVDFENKFVLGGIFPVHSAGSSPSSPCGPMTRGLGVQLVEAMWYAVDLINKDSSFKLQLDALILDSCSSESHGLDKSLEFLEQCTTGNNTRRVTAVVGAGSSPISESIAKVMRLFKIPQVSYGSTSETLDDHHTFPYFFRVMPSDKYQVHAILALVKEYKWSYLSAVTSEGDYGEKAIKTLEEMVESNSDGLCLATVNYLPRDQTERDYDNLISTLVHKKAKIVVVFLSNEKLKLLLKAAKRSGARGYFVWLVGNAWGAKVPSDLEVFAEGIINILPTKYPIKEFDNHFHSSVRERNRRNRWATEYLEAPFCSSLRCKRGNFKLFHKQERLVASVIDSVHVIAHALRNLLVNNSIRAGEFVPGKLLKEYIANVSFESLQGHGVKISFDDKKSIPVHYTVYQFRKMEGGKKYDFVAIGNWSRETGLAFWEKPCWRFSSYSSDRCVEQVNSSCSDPCKPGEETVRWDPQRRCCWQCKPCEGIMYLSNLTLRCTPCQEGSTPNELHTSCYRSELEFLGRDWSSAWTLVPNLFSCLGTACTVCCVVIFTMYRETPAIKASGRELCHVIFLGIILCYSFTFIASQKPTVVGCGILRLSLGLSLTVCYAAILTKTIRLSRIFNRYMSSSKRPSYTGSNSQMVIVFCMIAVQILLSLIWLIIRPPDVLYHYNSMNPAMYLITCGFDQTSVVVGLLYNFLLIFLCTVYAFKTRNIPENFNEAKYISFAMYSTCIIWLAFLAIYNSTMNDFRMQAIILCMSVTMSGTVVLVCMFVPKLYLVLFKPHKNVMYQGTSTQSGTESTPVRYLRNCHEEHCPCKPSPSPDLQPSVQ